MSRSSSTDNGSFHLEAGTHWICACGAFQNWPCCDGGHQGSQFQPLALTITIEVPKVVEIAR